MHHLTLPTLSNAINQEGQCPGSYHPVILTETDILTLKVRVKEQQQQSG